MLLSLALAAVLIQDPTPTEIVPARTEQRASEMVNAKKAELVRVREMRKEELRLKIIRLQDEIEKTREELERIDKWFPTAKVAQGCSNPDDCIDPGCKTCKQAEPECTPCCKAAQAARAEGKTPASECGASCTKGEKAECGTAQKARCGTTEESATQTRARSREEAQKSAEAAEGRKPRPKAMDPARNVDA